MIDMASDDPLTPLGTLLEGARGSRSVRSVAKAAAMSEGRWRQVVIGIEKRGDNTIPARPKSSTVAAMARAVGVDVATALRAAGFSEEVVERDATAFAEQLRDLTGRRDPAAEAVLDGMEAKIMEVLEQIRALRGRDPDK